MRDPERLPLRETEAGVVRAQNMRRGSRSRLIMHAAAETGVVGRERRQSQASFVQGCPCQGLTRG
eukprot:364644-Chlamydomonas_euryale.AAC.6